jgi:hypothetical protein
VTYDLILDVVGMTTTLMGALLFLTGIVALTITLCTVIIEMTTKFVIETYKGTTQK